MSQFFTIVHVAAAPLEHEQRCLRCQRVLISGEGAMSMDGAPMRIYSSGAFVGYLYRALALEEIPGSALNDGCTEMVQHVGSVLMDHDATEADEKRCHTLLVRQK